MTPSIILGTVCGSALLIIGLILKFSRIERNSLFGYRTYRSMKNEENWIFANNIMATYSITIGIISILGSILYSFIFDSNIAYLVFSIITLLLIAIIKTESQLKKFENKL